MAPTIRTREIELEIIDRLAQGRSLLSICADEDIPVTDVAVRKWALVDPEGFGAEYAHARDLGLDARSEKMLDDASAATDASLGRLKFDANRWYLSKLAPKRYGDKLDLNAEINGNLTINVNKPA